ncbi:unnamed protein product [Colias eurytheme]|nr:unnamed protein product [Colias eurytheme]
MAMSESRDCESMTNDNCELTVRRSRREELDRQIQLELKYFLLFPLGTIQKVLTLYAEHEQYKGRSQ